jgi:hypothetical protein
MAKGISISVASETRAFSAGIKSGVVDPLEDVKDRLDKVGTESERTGEELEGAFRGAQQETKRLKSDFSAMALSLKSDSRTAGKEVDRNLRDGTDGAKAGIHEVGDEAASTAKETAASFDGSAESIVGAFQEVSANAFAGFGPAGLVAGLAAAAGIGLISAAIMEGQEGAVKLKEEVSALTAELINVGDGGPSLDYMVDRLKSLATSTEDGVTNLGDLKDAAKGSGSSFRDLAQAYAGNATDLDKLVRKNEKYLTQLQIESENIDQNAKKNDGLYASVMDKIAAQQDYNKYLGEAQKIAKEAATAEENYLQSGGAAMEARAAAIETLQGGLDDAVAGYDEFKNAESGALDPAAYLAAIQARTDATANFSTNVSSITEAYGLSIAESQAILDQGVSFAPMLQSIIDSGLAPQFIDQIKKATGGGQEILDGAPLTGTISVEADIEPAEKDTHDWAKTSRETDPVSVEVDTAPAEAKLAAIAAKRRTATVEVELDTSAANRALNAFTSRSRSLSITVNAVDRNGKRVD